MSIRESGCRISVTRVKAEDQLVNEIEEQLSKKVSREELLNRDPDRIYDAAYRKRLETSFHFRYPYEADVALNTKMSVSAVSYTHLAGKKRELKLFGSHLDKIGFIGELKSMLSEFFQYGITAEVLEELVSEADKENWSAMLKQKLNDCLLYTSRCV